MTVNSIPLYLRIENDLRFKIDSGEWTTGDRIPPEKDLEQTYKVSRITIRRALNELVLDGYLERQRAKGTFVKQPSDYNPKDSYTVVTSFTQEMHELGKKPSTIWAQVEKIPATPLFARRLHVKTNSPLLKLSRVRGADSEAITYSETFIGYRPEYSLDAKDYYDSLYDYLAQFKVRVNEQTEYVEAVEPTQELSQLLEMTHNEPLLKRVREASDFESNYYEYSVNYYIGSKYRFYVKY